MINFNIPSHVKGDTFNGINFTTSVDGAPLDLTGASITMDVRLLRNSESYALRLTSVDNGGISIDDDPTTGSFSIDSQIIDIPAAMYVYDIEITLSGGAVSTYVGGKWHILQDVTRE